MFNPRPINFLKYIAIWAGVVLFLSLPLPDSEPTFDLLRGYIFGSTVFIIFLILGIIELEKVKNDSEERLSKKGKG